MRRRAIIQPEAERDLVALAGYIRAHSPVSARRFTKAARDAIRRLVAMPRLGGLWESSRPEHGEMRFWVIRHFENYVIFYRPIDKGIEVVRILHAARDIESLL